MAEKCNGRRIRVHCQLCAVIKWLNRWLQFRLTPLRRELKARPGIIGYSKSSNKIITEIIMVMIIKFNFLLYKLLRSLVKIKTSSLFSLSICCGCVGFIFGSHIATHFVACLLLLLFFFFLLLGWWCNFFLVPVLFDHHHHHHVGLVVVVVNAAIHEKLKTY